MPLSDAQIERYSRQIILPEVGAAGQQRLLAAACAVVGTGPLAATAARYLAGAGIGRLMLVGADADALVAELSLLNPDVEFPRLDAGARFPAVEKGGAGRIFGAGLPAARPASEGRYTIIAADLPLPDLDTLVRTHPGSALIAAGLTPSGGWLHTSGARGCAGCAARAAATVDRPAPAAMATIAAGVLGAIAALEAIKHSLGLSRAAGDDWFAFDAAIANLQSHALARVAGCAACAARSVDEPQPAR